MHWVLAAAIEGNKSYILSILVCSNNNITLSSLKKSSAPYIGQQHKWTLTVFSVTHSLPYKTVITFNVNVILE